MKNIFRGVLIITLLNVSIGGYGQSNLTAEEVTEFTERFNKAGGTYQIQVIDSREKPAIQLSVINDIENARKQNEVAFVYVKQNIRIKVLPLSVINSEDFTAVERIIYVNSSEI